MFRAWLCIGEIECEGLRLMRRPVIGFVCDVTGMSGHIAHLVVEKYLYAVTVGSDAVPILIPGRICDTDGTPATQSIDYAEILDLVDGIFLPGSPSNVAPALYGRAPEDQVLPADPNRDAMSLGLIHAALAAGVPMLGVCRGCQEMNVAFGGTLHPKLHDVGDALDHRFDKSLPIPEQYAPAHEVSLEPGGQFARWTGEAARWRVNSLHEQGVDRLAPGMVVEARAPDGLVEAFHHPGAKRFTTAIQWHPEFRFDHDVLSSAIFKAFGDAARERATDRPIAR
ncbi:gamma-glutamyl-gamma-aminobutyrate hydrolase family protein [Acidisoma cladoniae]|jgi:putative glutamine amidotransferase|uniref:gamma-glutamyl-gamma-aminobutyrate hydrolase family protein n=1 Tax=Acidisoma cladoniae TaxID=3040935 RepID=UPI0033138F2B